MARLLARRPDGLRGAVKKEPSIASRQFRSQRGQLLVLLSRLPAPADRQQPPGPSRFGRALQRHGVCGAVLPLRFCKRLKRALHPHGLPFAVPLRRRIYCPLTTLAHHRRMKSRDNMADVIEGLRKEHGLLAAFLEAADKLDCLALSRRVAMAKPINVEAHQASAAPVLPQVAPLTGSFALNSSTRQPGAGF